MGDEHGLREHEQFNRREWDKDAAAYQGRHAAQLDPDDPAWGVWRLREDELRILGTVAGKRMLELGCGGAQHGAAFIKRGARVVGIDLSAEQLRFARATIQEHAVDMPLVLGTAETLPFADESFDVVFCDHGAMSFTDPHRSVPEAARVLRRGGLFAFSMTTPWLQIFWPIDREEMSPTPVTPYYGKQRLLGDGEMSFVMPYGEWIRLFRSTGLVVEDLVELQAPEQFESSYWPEPVRRWARDYPAEHIWIARKV